MGSARRPARGGRIAARLAAAGLICLAGGLAGCQSFQRPYRPDFAGGIMLLGNDFWEATLVDVSVPFDPARPVRVGDLGIPGSVRVTGLRPLPPSVVDELAARERSADPAFGTGLGRMTITARVRLSALTMDQATRRVRNATVALVDEPGAQVVRLIAPGAAGHFDHVSYDITVDQPTSLTVRTGGGNVAVTRMAGDLDIVARSGDIDVDAHGGFGRRGTFVRAISQVGDVRVDAASETIVVAAEQGKATVDWSLGRQPEVLDVVSLERPQLPATTRYSRNVRVTIRDEELRREWRDTVRGAWADAGDRDAAGG